MDPVTLVAVALGAGAIKGAGEVASDAIRDAYGALRQLVAGRFAGQEKAEQSLQDYLDDQDTYRKPVEKYLAELGAADDEEMLQAAQHLMSLIDDVGTMAGRYSIDLRGAQGVQVNYGGGSQTNTFGR